MWEDGLFLISHRGPKGLSKRSKMKADTLISIIHSTSFLKHVSFSGHIKIIVDTALNNTIFFFFIPIEYYYSIYYSLGELKGMLGGRGEKILPKH